MLTEHPEFEAENFCCFIFPLRRQISCLRDAAQARGTKVIMDLVVNHTSDGHEWFQKSWQRIEPYVDCYIWRPAKKDGSFQNNRDSNVQDKARQWDDPRHLFLLGASAGVPRAEWL